MQELFQEIELEMKQGVEHFQDELKKIRTGRASTTMLDGVRVDYYGTETPLNQLANLSVADATLINVQPFDPSQIDAIEKAIQASGLGFNPSNDGRLVRVPVPQLTEERRIELVKQAHQVAENHRNRIRQNRRDGNDMLKSMEKDKEISQDDEKRGHDEMQKLHDKYIAEINSILDTKEKDIMEV